MSARGWWGLCRSLQRTSLAAGVLLMVAATLPTAHAQVSYTWAAGTAGGNWSTTTNWTPTGAPTNMSSAFFTDATGSVTTSMDVALASGSSTTSGLWRLEFNTSNNATFTVNTAAPLRLSNGSGTSREIGMSSGTSATINLTSSANNIRLNTAARFINDSASGTLLISGSSSSIDLAQRTLTLAITNAGRIEINAPITGTLSTSAVTINAGANGGIVTFGGNNTYAGLTRVNTGTVNVLGTTTNSTYLVLNSAVLAGTGSLRTFQLGVGSSGGQVSPGNALNAPGAATSIGTLTATNGVQFGVGSSYLWELGNAAGVAGTGWDLVSTTTLTLIQTSTVKTIVIENFDPTWNAPIGRSYKIIGTTTAVTSAQAAIFVLALGPGGTASWNGYGTSAFFLEGRSDGLYLVEIPEWDVALGACAMVGVAIAFQRRRLSKKLCPVAENT